ncbi:copper chaperone PCu(A)C [Streptomyces sp. AC512_CC834]|uniref:copper chaperone PCu(A)C n=1 Tax=Streptomyces sp. AC512_CC834 TaxID=2823691 RepID=UPI001C257117|nr:copper chaperone PCu(A)C [Streptomyces sp. AC512_CC834]
MTRLTWRLSRRRLTDTALAAAAPVVACGIALGALTAWAGAGGAGSPTVRINVSYGRVFLPFGETTETSAYFDITNTGDTDDRLVAVTHSGEEAGLSRHVMTPSGAASKKSLNSVDVSAGTSLSMSPHGVDVTLTARPDWRPGDLVRFTLRFERRGTVDALAVVTPPGAPNA